ncbi:MAG: UDP-2,3-diacylglucosamine diphosphatase LpxI [Pseudomonadota bacterium]
MGESAKLAIIAGSGDLPRMIAEHRAKSAAPYVVISFDPDIHDWMQGHPHERHLYERPARLFRALRAAGVTEVVFAGATNRPRLRPWLFDHGTLRVGATVLSLLRQGDDALLTGLARIFEREGFTMRGADEVLPGLGVQPGVLGHHRPSEQDRSDAQKGADILAALSAHDVGQAVVIAKGTCLAIEAIDGTDAMLERVAGLAPDLRKAAQPPAGVLVKMPKRGQDRRVDLPTIGTATIDAVGRAGLSGIAVEAGGTNILNREATVAAADSAGLFIWAMDAPE